MRVKRGVTARARHKKILKQTKGMQHGRRRSYKLGKQAVTRSLQYAYRDRRTKKRDFSQLWIARINAAARIHGMSYSQLIAGLKSKNIDINRKVLSELAIHEPHAFEQIVKATK